MEGIRLVMNYILPLAITERKHRLVNTQRDPHYARWSSAHRLVLLVAKRNTRTVYIELLATYKRVGVFDISGFTTVCGKIADSLERFDECRRYVEGRGCTIRALGRPDEPYLRSEYEILITDAASWILDASPMDLLTEYYIPLFIAEFGQLDQSESDPNSRAFIEIATTLDACPCSDVDGGGCGCYLRMPDIMTMPERDAIDRPLALTSHLITEIHHDLLSNFEDRCEELPERGYRVSTDGSTCHIRRVDFIRAVSDASGVSDDQFESE